MRAGKELLFARGHPLAAALGARVLGAGAAAGRRLSAGAAGFRSGASLSCTRRFINRRHLRLEERLSTDPEPDFFKGLRDSVHRDEITNHWCLPVEC